MICIENTQNFAGVQIAGDFYDLEDLYDALHHISKDEEELEGYGQPRLRLLSFCYEIRQALMGKRGTREIPNGSGENLYLTFNVLWPESLFISFALNDFIGHFKAQTGTHNWDPVIATARKFQSAVVRCLSATLSPARFAQLKKYFDPHGIVAKNKYQNYLIQYIDWLNIQHLRLLPEERRDHISVIAKRIGDLDHFYYAFRADFLDNLKETGLDISVVNYNDEYPKEFEW